MEKRKGLESVKWGEIYYWIREISDVPLLLVTAKKEDIDKMQDPCGFTRPPTGFTKGKGPLN